MVELGRCESRDDLLRYALRAAAVGQAVPSDALAFLLRHDTERFRSTVAFLGCDSRAAS